MDSRRLSMILGGMLALGHLGVSTAHSSFHGFSPETAAQDPASNGRLAEVPSITACSINGEDFRLDGKLDDPLWQRAQAGAGFRVWDPDRGAPPSEETVFKVAYDSDAIYFAVACLEKDPGNIASNLARRDRFSNSDLVSIYIDPYLDKTTGYNFRVNPSGVLVDAYMFNDGDRDDDWDAVWEAETHTDEDGWYTEMRIPFSSIRYRPAEEMTWGLQVYRYMHRRGEDTAWVIWDRETRGFISRFGELQGLRGVPAPRQLEVIPYFLQSTTDPSRSGSGDELDNVQNLGADVKYGITADLTLNATVQPDFGQVEADPAVLNLSPFETFFDEKRPFFIEGSRFFSHPGFNLFYSRRIGTGDKNSRIRFAGKLTGKTSNGVSVAGLVATTDVTGHGQAHNIFEGGERKKHFFVGRVGKEFKDGAHRFNLMQTAAVKSADRDEAGDFESREAYTTGLDFDLNFDNRNYNIQGSLAGSVLDPEESIEDPALSGERVYGTGGSMELRKLGGNTRAGTWFGWESDKLNINDVGFLSSPDEIYSGFWASHDYNPEGKSSLFNRVNLNFNFWKSWLYAARHGKDTATGDLAWSYGRGHRQYQGGNVNGWMQYRNFYETWWGVEYLTEGTQRYETRGGPLIDEPTTVGFWWGGVTDTRKKLSFRHEGNYYWDVEENVSVRAAVGIEWTQSTTMSHEIDLAFRTRNDDTQYLETVDLGGRPGGIGIGNQSYVFGHIHQKTLDLTVRTNLLFTRNQSLELYVQPFLTVGDYIRARELVTPDSYDLVPYQEPGFAVADFDFSFASVNLNAVYRWEYRPGSTFYLVWTHARSRFDERSDSRGRFNNELSTGNLFQNEPENIFLAKISYWFSL